MSTRAYVLVRHDRNETTRPCWSAQPGSALYCGICMRATVEPVIGEACPACESRVERLLEVVDGGKTCLRMPRLLPAGSADASIHIVRMAR